MLRDVGSRDRLVEANGAVEQQRRYWSRACPDSRKRGTRHHRPAHRIGVLLVNPGGPGASCRNFALHADTILPAEVTARYDVVGFDPRGTGASAPIRCAAKPGDGGAVPDDETSFQRLVATNKAAHDDCRARNGALVDHVGTRAVADDMDDLRAA
ncbi:hypothetical protein [Amycolatopsis sp. H20-H5]|uniref:hypothetical protein n=1 Tax=Amycolatopsis sp. H20-H5 TaxID=3046309 RepID=UPI002DB7860B|nr:hypothetical protein [Amycolatopsis sp. H20-H5]MEC3982846.1 hypothetical protein [Amycolatopsis sp. H20-H5]